MTRLKKLDSIIVPKIIISIHTMHLGKVICFAFSDGTVQYRDRVTMAEVYNERNLDSIMTLHQVGFQFTNDTPCKCRIQLINILRAMLTYVCPGLQVAFSPTNCSFAQICEDGSVKWNRLHYPAEDASAALQGSM